MSREYAMYLAEHRDYMKLSDKTRKTVEDILDKIKQKLEEIEKEE